MKNYVLIALLITLISAQCFSQGKTETLTNTNVIALFKAGLSKSVIMTTIQNSATNFDTSTNAIIDLKKQGVPDEVIEAMVNKAAGGSAPSYIAPSQNQGGSIPSNGNGLSTLEPGIYYDDPASGTQIQLDGSVFSQTKSGSGVLTAISYGIAKTRSKSVLSGAQANFRINNTSPVFYFVFPHNSGNFGNEASSGGWYSDATSPNEFLLVKFKVQSKGREVITGSYGTYSGFSGGIDDDNKIAFRFTKVSPGIYKVYLESPLKSREYAFMFGGTTVTARGGAAPQKAFDFSITGNDAKDGSDARPPHPPPPNPLDIFKKKKADTTSNGNN